MQHEGEVKMSYAVSTDMNPDEKAELQRMIADGYNLSKNVSKLIRAHILKQKPKARKS
jgi:hypothetical protein